MKILNGYSKVRKKNTVLTIGNFDGVHKGHQEIIKQTVKLSKKNNLKSVVITFKPHPNVFFKKDSKPFKLTNEETKIEEIKKLGVDYLIFMKFDKNLNKLLPENFVKKLINFRPKFIVVGYNFHFGYRRKGDVHLLKKLSKKYLYTLKIIKPVIGKNKRIFNSTFIRKKLESGQYNIAKEMLGRNWLLEGKIVKGSGRGRELGYPTANFVLSDYVLPMKGVYVTKSFFEKNKKKKYFGIANIGNRPTFNEKKLRNKLKKNKKFTLHDGPPYANGHLHMGHALNKILKDIIIRSKQMQGFDAAFVPGWDCHGLPIEWEVEQELRKKGDEKKNISIKEFRNKCRKFAEHWIKIQKKEFERFGVLGDWENYYSTMSYKVEAQIIREIGKFLLNGSLYKGSRPVMWSVVEKTALADAEIEYKDRLDNAIYVLFPIDKTNVKIEDKKNVNILIWTTTPWTIPGNRALAFNKSFSYSLLKENSSDTYFIVASDLVNKLKNDTGLKIKKIRDFNGKDLEKTICKHPLDDFGYKFKVPLLAADFVTKEEGTGIVHIAPGHGLDDFNLAKQNNIDVPKTIDESGIYYEDIPLLKGVHVFKADDKVIEFLEKSKKLLYKTDIFHSYPHSWRSKKPLIYRNTTQWFISLEKGNLREKAINALKDIDFFPKKGKNRITSMIKDRPDWCISRQRFWGVPLPIFINKKTNNPLIDRNVIENIARIFEKKGSDSWFELDPSEFLGNKYNKNDFIQVKDVIEVWFDSGSSHVYVLEDRKDLIWPADLYLEGSDQHRGWFHSSLLQSCGTRNKAPFKSILSHGFVVDGKGKKMSKSEGNVISPNEIINKYGTDILRLWTVASDYFEDIRIDENIIKSQIDSYRRIRNTLRFLIGNLKGFEDKEKTDYKNLPGLEKYILFRIWEIDKIIESSIKENNYHKIYKELLLFCSNDLSSFYFDIRKDCLYCDDKSNQKRKSCRSTLKIIFNFLTAWLAPILCFTAEEAWLSDNFNHKDSIHLRMFPKPDKKWADINFGEKWKEIINIRKVVTSAIEIKREKKIIGSSLEASVELSASNKMKDYINDMNLNDLFIVSSAKIVDKLSGDIFSLDGINDIKVSIKKAEGSKCERCWIISKEVNNNKNLCNRCNGVVNDNTKK